MPGASGLTKTSTPSGVASSGHLFSTCILVGRPYSQLDLQPLPEPRFDPAVRDCQTDQPRNRKGGPGKRDAAGIDVGNASHFVAISPKRDSQPVREFRCFTEDLRRLAACGRTPVGENRRSILNGLEVSSG